MDIFSKVKRLSLPIGHYVVFGSGPLVAHGIRKSRDLDLLVTSKLYQKLKSSGWQEKNRGSGVKYLSQDEVEVFDNWKFGEYNPTPEELIKRAELIKGIPFASLEEVLKWKKAYGRPKDLDDIDLIRKYLSGI